MGCCSAPNCSNDRKHGVRLFRFPRQEDRRKLWTTICLRHDWKPSENSRLCEVHFTDDQFEQNRADGKKPLKWNAVPTIFSQEPPIRSKSSKKSKASPESEVSESLCCCVPSCESSSGKGIKLSRFPDGKNDLDRRSKWIAAINKGPDWKPNANSSVCELHFLEEDWEKTRVDGTRKLRRSAVPTVNLPGGSKQAKKSVSKDDSASGSKQTSSKDDENMDDEEQEEKTTSSNNQDKARDEDTDDDDMAFCHDGQEGDSSDSHYDPAGSRGDQQKKNTVSPRKATLRKGRRGRKKKILRKIPIKQKLAPVIQVQPQQKISGTRLPLKICINANTEPFAADVVFPKGVPKGGSIAVSVGKHNQKESNKENIFVQTLSKSISANKYPCFVRPILEEKELGKSSPVHDKTSALAESNETSSGHQGLCIRVPVKKSLSRLNQKTSQDTFRTSESVSTLKNQTNSQQDSNSDAKNQQDVFKVPESPNTLRIQNLLQEAMMETKKDENAKSCSYEGQMEPLDSSTDDAQNVTIQVPIKHSIRTEEPVEEDSDDISGIQTRSKRRSLAMLPKNVYAEDGKAAMTPKCDVPYIASDSRDDDGFNDTDIWEANVERNEDASKASNAKDTTEKTLQCPYCSVVETNENKLEWHKKMCHADKAPFKCDCCKKGFFKDSLYKNHQEVCSKEKKDKETKKNSDASGEEKQATKVKIIPFSCDDCPAYFKVYDNLMSHVLSSHPEHELFTCIDCRKPFAHVVFLLGHQALHEKEKDPDGDWDLCKLCSKKFPSLEKLQSHMMSHSVVRLFRCSKCNARFNIKDNLVQHMKTHVITPKTYKCNQCSETFTIYKKYKEHMLQTHDANNVYTCDQCSKTFTTNKRCKEHITLVHKTEFRNECRYCHRKYSNKGRLLQHLGTVHFNDLTQEEIDSLKELSCDDCGFKTYNKKSFMLHRAKHTGDYPHKCTQCSAKYVFNFNLNRHMRLTHKMEGGQCPHCPRVFAAKEPFESHLSMHSNGTGFICERCKKMYETKRLYDKHCSTCKEIGSFLCHICNLTLPSRTTLSIHRAVHKVGNSKECSLEGHEVRNHQCNICYSWFKFKSSLIAHQMVVHESRDLSGNPACNICHRTFKNNMLLSNHIRNHIEERPYKCPYCSKSFKQYLTKRNHIICVHTKKFRVHCPLCQKGFLGNTKLRSHLKLGHKAMDVQNKTPNVSAGPKRLRKQTKITLPPLTQPQVTEPNVVLSSVSSIPVSASVSHLTEMKPMASTSAHVPPPSQQVHAPAHVGEMDSTVKSLISAMTYKVVPCHEEPVSYSSPKYTSL